MVYCSVACCNNGNHNRSDLSYFIFPSDKRLGTWIKFCRRADKRLATEATKAKTGKTNNLRICSAHFDPKTYRKTLNGRRETYDTALPTIFRPNDECTPRSVRYETAKKKRRLEVSDHIKTCLSRQFALVDADGRDVTTNLADVRSSNDDFRDVQHDQSYCFSAEGVLSSNELFQDPEPEKVSVGFQTDMTMFDLEQLENEVKNLKNRLADKAKLKRDMFMEDVLKNDDSVKFYTGIPTLGCFNLISDYQARS